MAVFEAKNLSKRFGGLQALSNVSFEISAGEVLGMLGPNGAGKSTLINVVSGFHTADEGQIRLDGKDVTRLDMPGRARAGLVRSFQNVRPSEELALGEILKLARHAPSRRNKGGFTEVQIAEICGLNDYLDRPHHLLPYGIQKIANLAATLLCNPSVLLLDEPFAGVSEEDIATLSDLIRRFQSTGVAIGLVEHNIGSVMALCDRVLVLDSGSLIFSGLPDEATRDPNVQVAYLGKRYSKDGND